MKNRIKVLIRILLKDKVFSIITIGGLAVSLGITILLASYLVNESTYDKGHPNLEQIYRLSADKRLVTFDESWKSEIEAMYPEIKKVSRYDNTKMDVVCNDEPYNIEHVIKADDAFFQLFPLNFIFGDKENPIPTNNCVAISSSLANRLFGNKSPLGEIINVRHRKSMTVSAVFDDFDKKSSIQAQMIMKWENVNSFGGESRSQVFHTRLFLLLNEGVDTSQLEEKISNDFTERHYAKRPFRLLPFRKSYLSPLTMGRISQTLHADLNSILLYSAVTVLILIISILNFIILSTSNHLSRLEEIGLKKTIGAGRKELFRQFLYESMVVSIISSIVGGLLAWGLKGYFETLVKKDIPVDMILTFPYFVYFLFGVIAIGFIAGFYPSVIISKFKPSSIFQSSLKGNRLRIKSGLSVIQYTISLILIISVVIMMRQNTLLVNKDIGFSKEQLICINIDWQVKDKIPLLKEQLLKNPYIKNCTASHGIPGRPTLFGMWVDAREKYEYNGNIPHFSVDPDFFKTYDVQFIHGRGFEQRDWGKAVVLNESAFRLTGWESIEEKMVKVSEGFQGKTKELPVIGVVKDFNVEKLNQPIAPTSFDCSYNYGVSYLTCKILPGDYQNVMTYIEDVWNETCPQFLLNTHFYDVWLDSLYKQERHSAYVIRLFAILAIIITCMGTLGVIHFTSRQRIKEIGIRKVNGAKVSEILAMHCLCNSLPDCLVRHEQMAGELCL